MIGWEGGREKKGGREGEKRRMARRPIEWLLCFEESKVPSISSDFIK